MCQDCLKAGSRMLGNPHWKHDLGPRMNGLWKAQRSQPVTPSANTHSRTQTSIGHKLQSNPTQ